MRIGYLTYGLDRAPTGIGRYAVALLEALAGLPGGPEITLLTTERNDPHGLWGRFERHALPGCHLLPGLLSVGNLALSHAISRHRLDLVHDPNGIAPFLGPAHGARRLVTLFDAFAFITPQTHNWLDNWRYRYMLPRALRNATGIITISMCSQQDLNRYLGIDTRQVAVTYLAADRHFMPIAAGPARDAILKRYAVRRPYLLYLGGINARKNIARLLAAYAELRARRPELTLVIAGKRQWATAEVDQAMARLALEPHVHFTGYVPDADLPALYSAAEVFVFPSLYEGFGLPPLEAMACGTPVVTSNRSSLPEVVGDAALLVDPYDVPALAAAIERVLDDAPLRAELQRRGFARAARFTWEQVARETLAVYYRALGAHPAPNGLEVVSER